MNRSFVSISLTTLLALAMVSCGSGASTGPTPTPKPPTTGGTGASRPNTVSGQVLDQAGQPLAGALIWVLPAVTTGIVTLHSNDQGRYEFPALVNVPYRTFASFQKE